MSHALPDKAKIKMIRGVPVPYIPSSKATIVKNGKTEVRDTPPHYINNFETWEKNGSPYTFKAGILSMKREILLAMVRSSTLNVRGFEAPLAVSAAIPAGCVAIDGQRIILNEGEALWGYRDADGDRGTIHYDDDRENGILVKFPITMHPSRLKVLGTPDKPYRIREKFYDFGTDAANEVKSQYPMAKLGETFTAGGEIISWDRRALFEKKHHHVPVGLLTHAWNLHDLYTTRKMPYWEKLATMFATQIDEETGKPKRALDIEEGGMKAARKEGKSHEKAEILKFGASKGLAFHHGWALTGTSSIGSLRENQLEWVLNTKLPALLSEIQELNLQFRDINPNPRPTPPPKYVEGSLITRLSRLGLLRWIEYPLKAPNMPPAVVIFLTLTHDPTSPTFQTVGLVDVKRADGRPEGMTFCFFLYPVLDMTVILDEEGNEVIPASKKYEHPITFLAKQLTTLDTTVRAGRGGDILDYFPSSVDEWKNPERSVKVTNIQKAILEHCGKYGDPCPARNVGGQIRPHIMAEAIATRTVVIDYGRDMTEDEMWPIAEHARSLCNICTVGSKSTSERVRKYVLANKSGQFTIAPKGCHPVRPATNRSQLLRSLEVVKMNVAIVKMDTRTQILITPSGIAKQTTNDAFLPQVFTTYEDYEKHLEGHGFTKEEHPAREVHYPTWTGEHRVCWVLKAKASIKIGKLIDTAGNKFMPRQIGQVKALRTHQVFDREDPTNQSPTDTLIDIDLLFPIDEAIDKYSHWALLDGAEEVEIEVDGQKVLAMMVEYTFYRTGSASENIPPRNRTCAYKGIDRLPIQFELMSLNKTLVEKEPDLGYAMLLQEAAIALIQENEGETPVAHNQQDDTVSAWFQH